MDDTAGRLLLTARRAAGLSQRELARLAGTSQPAVSAYETGRKNPSVSTLMRLLAAAGATLRTEPAPDTTRGFLRSVGLPPTWTASTLADAGTRMTAGEDPWFTVREFLDGVGLVAETVAPPAVAPLVAREPDALPDPRLDALLAALAEHLSLVHGFVAPHWVGEPRRFLDRWWFPHQRRAFDAQALRDSPAAFRRRGIFLCPSMLERV